LSEISIRGGTPGDEGAIAGLAVRAWRVGFRGIVPEEIDPQRAWRPEKLTERLGATDPRGPRTLIAEVDRHVAGFALFGPCRDEDAAEGWGEIWALYVDPDRWRRGVGSSLVHAAVAQLEDAGFAEASVWTLAESLRNLRFYESLGFVRDGATQRRQSFGSPLEVRLRLPL
jgi:GNAT superfamily N-acetyltransferase